MARTRISVALLAVLALTGAALAKDVGLKEYVKANSSKTAMGVYLNGKKIGWSVSETKLGKFEGQDVQIKTEQQLMLMQARGAAYRIESVQKSVRSLAGKGELLYFEQVGKQNGKEIRHVARPKGANLEITTTSDATSRSRIVPMSKDTVREEMRFQSWVSSALRAGDQTESVSFSVGAPETDQKFVVRFVKSGRMKVEGVPTDVLHFSMSGSASRAELISTKSGKIVELTMGTMVFKAESEEQARKLTTVSIDADFQIRVKQSLGSPLLIDRLTLEITGLKKADFHTSHRQRILSEANGVLTVELCRDYHDASIRHPLSAADRKKYLDATGKIQSDAATIRELARKIVGSEKQPLKQAGLLQEWVFANLKKTYAISASTSLQVLKNKAGKCTDHALLFTALSRSIGLPAREITGLMFEPVPNQPQFAWHAWAEIHDGVRWISIDPTLGEVLIDGTHVRFSGGSGTNAMMRKISVTVKRFETNGALVGAMGRSGISTAIASRMNLKLLRLALDRNTLTGKDVAVESQRMVKLIDASIAALEKASTANISTADQRGVALLIGIFRSLKVQAEALKSFSERRDNAQKAKLEQAEANAKKQFAGIGV